ncbi:MAG TPA: GGDEF domain-containing protein [Terracidiphilus sp.]
MLVLALLAAVSWGSGLVAAQPPSETLTSIRAIRALTKGQLRDDIPVAFEATVTFYNRGDLDLFVQDGDDAIYVEARRDEDVHPGDRVLVRGKTRKSFSVDIVGESVTVLHHGPPPVPTPADFEHLIRAELDCRWVTVHATIRSADVVNFGKGHGVYLRLLMDGGVIDATVLGTDARLDELLDADVEISGVVSGKFDSKMQMIGILLEVPDLANLKILKHAGLTADSIPVTPMANVMSAYYANDRSRRVRVKGTITYYQPGWAVVLQNGAMSLWVSTHASLPMRVGDIAEATGFPDAREGFLTLLDGEIKDTNVFEPVQPATATWSQLSTWNSGDPNGHQTDLVSFEGVVMASVRADSQDEYVLANDGNLFTAIYRHPPSSRTLQAMKAIPAGTRIRVTGICMAEQAGAIDPTEQEVPFNILLRSFDDIEVVASPSALNVRNLVFLAIVLLALLIAAGVRAWVIERKIRRQNAVLAYVEGRRSRILEDINGSRPLVEILEQITELVSLRMPDALCWCQIADGAQLGNRPAGSETYRVVEEPIHSRSGPPHGVIYAAFHKLINPQPIEPETLSRAAALASLAIETRRLYSDLVRRSEFDMLTEIHNRFSLEKYIDEQIEQVRQSAGRFGLLYIDLNEFKQVNDVYGHKTGDLYLQEVAARVKHQLRGMDMLARLGGDEFAVVLPNVRSRAEVVDVSHRVERCIQEPFKVEGYVIRGSASIGIGLYPDDGSTRDAILSSADAAMYVNKQIRRESR